MTTKQGDKREAEAIEAIINEQATQGLLDALVQHQAGGMPLNAGLAAWSREQLSGVDLGNARRHRRFCAVLTRMAEHPQGSLPIQCRTSAELKGAYRAMRFPKVHAAGLMASHHSATMGHLKACPPGDGVVLAVQDTTTVNFTSHQALGGQGPIGKSRNSGTTGFHAHGTLVLGADGYVFGMLESEFYTRDAQAHEAKRRESLNKRNREKAEEKESARWLRSLRHTAALATARDTQTITVNVADREADMYELWLLAEELRAATPQLHLLIRSQHNRKLHGSDNSLHDTLAAQSAQARWKIELPAAKGIASKTRQVECVWQQATLAVPAHQKKYQGHTQTLKLWAIEVREPSPPTGAEALHWIILSTWPITDELSARRALGWYVQRWQIEVLHRTWKTGCKVEERRVQQPRVMKCLMMLDLMVAAQLMSVVKAARLSPEAPADKLLTAAQSECLAAHSASTSPAPGRPEKNIVHEAGNPAKETAQPGMTIGKAVENIARLGGYRGNIQKRPPGVEVLWRGLQRLNDLTSGWLLAKGQKSG